MPSVVQADSISKHICDSTGCDKWQKKIRKKKVQRQLICARMCLHAEETSE